MPIISVIIPVYNVEKYIPCCLESIINQTFKDIEIICIDDGSTDNSLHILQQYKSKDNRIIIISQNNQGAGAARNKGLEYAKGEYLSFIDPDDYIDYDFYEKLINIANKGNYDIVKGNLDRVNSDGEVFQNTANERIKQEMQKYNMPISLREAWTSGIYKKSLIDKYNITFTKSNYLEDMAFLYKLMCLFPSFAMTDDTYYHYYLREDSLTHKETDFEGKNIKYKETFTSREDVVNFINNTLTEETKSLFIFEKFVLSSIYTSLKAVLQEGGGGLFIKFSNRARDIIFKYKYIKEFDKKTNNKFYKYLKLKKYNKIKRLIEEKELTVLEKIFSVKNSSQKTHKVITLLGVKMKFRRKKNG